MPKKFVISPSKTSNRPCGYVASYAANSHCGTLTDVNEDRISIVTNIYPPKSRKHMFQSKDLDDSKQRWPRCSFFGIFDGHQGSECAEFLRDNLHKLIVEQECFPNDVKCAITRGV